MEDRDAVPFQYLNPEPPSCIRVSLPLIVLSLESVPACSNRTAAAAAPGTKSEQRRRQQLCNGAGAAPAHGAAPGLPLPPDGRGAHHALPRPQGRRRPLRRARRRRGRPQQVRALGPAIAGEDGGEGVVLLLPQGPQVPDGAEDEQGHGGRVLEGNGQGQGYLQGQRRQGARRLQEDARLLHWEGAQGREVRLGHARVPPPRQAPWRHRSLQGRRRRLQERVGAVQGVQEEPCRRRCSSSSSSTSCRQKGRHGDVQDERRHGGHLSPPSADGRVRRRRQRQPRGGGTRDLLLRRTGGPPVLQPAADAARSRRHGPPRPRRLLAVPAVRLRALRAAAPRRDEPGAAPGGQRRVRCRRRWRPPGHVQQAATAARAGAAVQGGRRAGAAERVAGHGAHLRREPRDLLLLRRPTVRPRPPLLGLLIEPHIIAYVIASD